jgi:hypothetical protein
MHILPSPVSQNLSTSWRLLPKESPLANIASAARLLFTVWRKQGAIGKLHNIVYYITHSDKRRRAFEAVQQRLDHGALVLQLVRDIGVRWNSSFAMIERALRLEHALRRYCMQWTPERSEHYDFTKDVLDSSD